MIAFITLESIRVSVENHVGAKKNIIIRTSNRKLKLRGFLLLLVVMMLLSLVVHDRSVAAVSLVYFRATGTSNGVVLEWETSSEQNNQGFYVNRSLSQGSGYTRVSNLILASGNPSLGGYYQFNDTNLTLGTTYWYKLESIDNQSLSELYEPPISALAGMYQTATPTSTGSATSLPTGTPTSTATARTRTPTPTFSSPYPPAPTLSAIVQQPANTPSVNQGQSPSGILTETLSVPVSGTATLIPFPEITLEFPRASIVNPAIPTPPTMPPASIADVLKWITPTRALIIIFILFVWLFLGGWFYSTIRRLG